MNVRRLLDIILADEDQEEGPSLHLPALLDELQGVLHTRCQTVLGGWLKRKGDIRRAQGPLFKVAVTQFLFHPFISYLFDIWLER